MNIKDILNKVKDFMLDKVNKFKNLSNAKKLSLIIAVVAVIIAIVFGMKYINNSKYQVLFSGLSSTDAANITGELENEKVDMKIKGDSILVPKDQVDELRIKLSPNITDGSKGYELMDEGSSFGMTDEEFKIKKQRMLQGEIEKTIKTFSQVADARVQIINGQESAFSNETQPGSAAVTITLKPGATLDPSQVRSIMSLVSASCEDVPKQNVQVVDQNMNLLSEGLYDANGKEQSGSSNGVYVARKAEKDLDSDLERAIKSVLGPMFGNDNVLVQVNADLNFDSKETTEIKVDPNKVAIKESKKLNTSGQDESTGGNVDNNMNNVGGSTNTKNQNSEEEVEYETGKTESKTIKAQGEINKVTASVAINANLDSQTSKNVEDIVSNIIGLDKSRGDSISVVGMKFGSVDNQDQNSTVQKQANKVIKTSVYIVVILLLSIFIIIYVYFKKNKNSKRNEKAFDDSQQLDIINQKIQEIEQSRSDEDDEDSSISLEEEVRLFAADNKDQVTDLIKNWLSE